ncbi:MAG: YiiD C-terminal domain-containing protein [Deltaproteobacteria bacterium]|nr:YiiD C-terminal domain-containing protein [Deltaproteobacteria bacterium]
MAIPRVDLVTWFNRLSAFPMGREALDRVLWRVVPFNVALKPAVTRVSLDEVQVSLRMRRTMANHLGSMHAAALFTVGEYVQGLAIMANTGAMGAELILVTQHIDYTAKARGDVLAEARITEETRQQVRAGLERGENTEVVLESVVKDAKTGAEVARLRGTWRARRPR